MAAGSLAAAAHELVATLAAQHGWRRVTLGLHERGTLRLVASSGLDLERPAGELPAALLGAMHEAVEQSRSLRWPDVPEADALPGGLAPVRLEHQALQALLGAAVATVPLGTDGEPFAAVCVERQDAEPIADDALRRLEQLLSLAVPALRWIARAEQPWHRVLRRQWRGSWDDLRRPEHRARRRGLVAAALALAFAGLWPMDHEVGGRARIEGAEQRVLAAPADGFVKAAHARPGDRVKAGQPLVDLVDADLRLERDRWASQLAQHENAYAAAMARSERSAAATSLARVGEAQAQLALVDEQLLRGRVAAPFDAVVIQGDLSQSIGTPVRQGDTLLTLASDGRYRVIVEVDEADVERIAVGQGGSLALSSLPWGREQALRVERIAPLARTVEGRNVFEVEASLAAPADGLRPGLLGRAGIVIGQVPPLWAWAGHALDRLRLAWWSWLG